MNYCISARLFVSLLLFCTFATGSLVAEDSFITVDASQIIKKADRDKLIGTNMALWDYPTRYYLPTTEKLLKAWHPGLVRIPGGSWSDEYFWNGNGVMKWEKSQLSGGYQFNQNVDKRKFINGKWTVDYSKYAPGFRVNKDKTISDFHGNFDIKRMQDYITKIIGTKVLVTVNAGTGTPAMAAEWVKWSNKKEAYNIKYWEVGNELEGAWEAGHFLSDGREMTGKIYAQRFANFAKAMKKVDPSIKVGGATGGDSDSGFTEAMLKYAGEYVDFVSFHYYPERQSLITDEQLFGHIFRLGTAIKHFKNMINKYQKNRADKIEIGITEWNCKLPEDRQTGDITSGLWTALFVGEMMKTGVSFANQWDIFTQKKKGGHCALHFTGDRVIPKSQYWAFWLWNNCMDDNLIKSEVRGNKKLHVIATRGKDNVSVMLVNLSRTANATAKINLKGFTPGKKAESYLFSHRSYLWNYLKNQPEWSIQPIRNVIQLPQNGQITLPPFSVRVVRIFNKGVKIAPEEPSQEIYPDVQYIVPEKIPVRRKVEAWAVYRKMGDGTPVPCNSRLKLKVTRGKATVTPNMLDLNDAAAKFYIEADEPGHLTIEGSINGIPVDNPPDDPPIYIKVIPVMEANKVFWNFETEKNIGKLSSTWQIKRDKSISRQGTVLAVKLDNVKTAQNKDVALGIKELPDDFPRTDIGGIFADVIISPDFKADPDSHMIALLQSTDNYWMPLLKIPLNKLSKNSDAPTKITGKIPDKFRNALGGLFSVRFIISSHKPINGTIYFDNIGFTLEQQ